MADPAKSLLFIPDISGFTEFVNETELNHSYHIIAELLELLIDANTLGMTVSEIEGDAILFYKYEDVPSQEAILAQAREMFLKFHQHLSMYEQQRLCNCGACRTANRLKLKIIVHVGNIRHLTIKEHRKIYGPDVILIHRLLKNDVPGDEYLLMTEEVLTNPDAMGQESWVRLHSGRAKYASLGEIPFHYIPLEPLYAEVEVPEISTDTLNSPNPIVRDIYIDRRPEEVYEIISNFEYRLNWQKGLKDLKYNKNELNRIGTEHVCVLEFGTLHFETVATQRETDELMYGEKLKSSMLFKQLVNYFVIQPEQNGSRLRHEIHYEKIKWPFRLLTRLIRDRLATSQQQQLKDLKAAAEQQALVLA